MQGAPARGEAELAAVRALGLAADDVHAIEVRAWRSGTRPSAREDVDVAWLRQSSSPGNVTLAVLRRSATGAPEVVARARFDAGGDARVSFEQDDPGGPALADLGGAFGVRVSTPVALENGSAWCTRLHVWRPRAAELAEVVAVDVAFESVRRAPPRDAEARGRTALAHERVEARVRPLAGTAPGLEWRLETWQRWESFRLGRRTVLAPLDAPAARPRATWREHDVALQHPWLTSAPDRGIIDLCSAASAPGGLRASH